MWQSYVNSNLGYEMFAGFDLIDCRQHWLVRFTIFFQLVAPGSINRLGSIRSGFDPVGFVRIRFP